VSCFAQDADDAGGSLGAQHADRMFLPGPAVVREVTGEDVTTQELGDPDVHARNGVCHFTVADDVDAILLTRRLLTYLPTSGGEPLPVALAAAPDPGASCPRTVAPGGLRPRGRRGVRLAAGCEACCAISGDLTRRRRAATAKVKLS
jgi:hypothetical protein